MFIRNLSLPGIIGGRMGPVALLALRGLQVTTMPVVTVGAGQGLPLGCTMFLVTKVTILGAMGAGMLFQGGADIFMAAQTGRLYLVYPREIL